MVIKIAIGVLVGITGLLVISIVVICRTGTKIFIWKKDKKIDQNIEAFIRNHESLAPKRFNFLEVKKMTNSFTDIVGRGGFGTVYKGKLADGCIVAVKVLSDSKGNGEDFINVVASVSRTSRVNIVTLVGFCYERTKRVLIYEFVPNGSLDKFIYDKETLRTNCNLEMPTLYRIAIGIARGLEYLHRGCNTRIVHFDIKPHNILLDEDFCPKISDFGLSKLCLKKESLISMTGARGNAGYIAPEVFCRSIGGVSHKSDVYSYGMMILEMVGGRKNIDAMVSHTSEIYFPHWIYSQIELGKDLRFHGDINAEEEKIAKKMIIVGLWCIQTNPFDRPSMTKVVEMLGGTLESLHIPPKPFPSSPKESPKHLSTTSSSS
ncbi:LOW QUALITY PROTEIN: LEAF RUST 10 DISEASE-RESISTANCE LOCUS RECEPTOR-LIKE PROTEIN KINASE-like 2.1 [Carica papaya]|uniref:LOW QUALITY PROTEIN: LEAF RUST 10 DISEASE-RESISTANCE LOCUS RECEPTOR-LIKE PROTEIN KINASE-like 2.1 n=1 Tax=Carica papaya TaxID=3649 RepID=UPI000B8CDE96|nr:LOW QUALITY PROTEIN: LEAF RUST 10 DISEASE-RESISTANCE LOCUS RECEPTOR-LIKE PROTEIN KINASE-like 2.1 [Carica papaya]